MLVALAPYIDSSVSIRRLRTESVLWNSFPRWAFAALFMMTERKDFTDSFLVTINGVQMLLSEFLWYKLQKCQKQL